MLGREGGCGKRLGGSEGDEESMGKKKRRQGIVWERERWEEGVGRRVCVYVCV